MIRPFDTASVAINCTNSRRPNNSLLQKPQRMRHPNKKSQPKSSSPTSSLNHFRFWSNNPCSLNKDKRDELTARIAALDQSLRPHAMFFVETWFNESSDTSIAGYQLHRKDRERSAGGGVAIYVVDEVVTSETGIPQLNSPAIEQVWRVICFGGETFLVGCLYRPHDLNDDYLTQCIASVTTARSSLSALSCSFMLLYGDFNFSHTKYARRGWWRGNSCPYR